LDNLGFVGRSLGCFCRCRLVFLWLFLCFQNQMQATSSCWSFVHLSCVYLGRNNKSVSPVDPCQSLRRIQCLPFLVERTVHGIHLVLCFTAIVIWTKCDESVIKLYYVVFWPFYLHVRLIWIWKWGLLWIENELVTINVLQFMKWMQFSRLINLPWFQ